MEQLASGHLLNFCSVLTPILPRWKICSQFLQLFKWQFLTLCFTCTFSNAHKLSSVGSPQMWTQEKVYGQVIYNGDAPRRNQPGAGRSSSSSPRTILQGSLSLEPLEVQRLSNWGIGTQNQSKGSKEAWVQHHAGSATPELPCLVQLINSRR